MTEQKKTEKDVVIHIDKDKYTSPDPTTGSALYILGKVDTEKYDLWKEVHGQGDDDLIPNDNTVIDLKNGDHFYTVKKDLNPGSNE